MLKARCLPAEGNRVFLSAVMNEAEGGADNRGNSGGESRTREAHSHGEHENIVEDNIKKAGEDRPHHGNGRIVVVSHIGAGGIIYHIKEGKRQNGSEVGNAEFLQLPVSS